MFSCPTRNAFYHVTRWCWQWLGGGRETAVSHQHSVNCSQPVAILLRGSEGQSSRVELKEVQGPKYLQLEGHPNLFSHIHGAHQASQACLSGVMCKSVARGEWVAAIWEWLCLFLIVSCLFTPIQLYWVLLFCSLSMLAQLPWLVQVLSPPCNLRLGKLSSSHSCTGVYISTCCSPRQGQKLAQLNKKKGGCFHLRCPPFSFTHPNSTLCLGVILQVTDPCYSLELWHYSSLVFLTHLSF